MANGRSIIAWTAAALAVLACTGCLRTNAQDDWHNGNGVGSTNEMPHVASGPNVIDTGGLGYYGSERWSPERPALGFGPLENSSSATIFTTDEPGTSNQETGTGNNGWGGAADRSAGVTGNSTNLWSQ